MNEQQNRFKSPVFWTAMAAQVLSILVYTGVLMPEMSDAIQGIVVSICEILVIFGIFNNPTNKKSV